MIDFDKIGKYKITGKLGQGSFGVVYQGRDAYLKRDVAIKVCSVEDEGLRKRFFREAEISGKLVHKNIVTVYEFGFEGEIPYLVQEMLSGEDLSPIIKRRQQMAPAVKLEILLQVANGLGYAHSEGVIHRDIKPGNIRLLEGGRVKIMDFGIAKLASAETQLTQKGVTMGTASYLPPEQVRGSELDLRADIFSFGVLAYELLTFERPFRGNTLSALIYQILYKVPRPMTDVWPECPERLSDLIAKCLDKKPDRRYGTFAELVPELSDFHGQLVAGKFPALQAPATDPAAAPASHDPSGVMSQAAIAQTARGVLEGKVGEYTISTAVSPQEILRPGPAESGRSTRPIAAMPAEAHPVETPPAEAPADDAALKTRVMAGPLPAVTPPDGGSSAAAAAPEDASEDLTIKAREIIDMVACGELEAETAKERLEATLSGQDAVNPVRAEAAGKPEADRKTRLMHLGPPAAESAPADGTAGGAEPGGTAAEPGAMDAGAANAGAVPPPAAPPPDAPDAGKSDTYRTVFRPPFNRLKWAGAAAAVVLAAGLGWLLLRDTGEPPIAPIDEPPPPPIAQPEPPPPPIGGVAVHATPWAQLTEITDAQGYVVDLPENPQTPLYLELAPGRYLIQLQDPQATEVQTCEVEVAADTVASCAPAFGEPSVTDYFKESGWWD